MKFFASTLLSVSAVAIIYLPLFTSAFAVSNADALTPEELQELHSQEPLYNLNLPEYASLVADIESKISSGATFSSPTTRSIHPSRLFRRIDFPVLKCETSPGSPLGHDVQVIATLLVINFQDRKCAQTNWYPTGSLCTTISTYKSARVALCGRFESKVDCSAMGNGIQRVRSGCTHDDGKCGGIYFPNGPASNDPVWLKYVVYHS
jgi:hypothetical protein